MGPEEEARPLKPQPFRAGLPARRRRDSDRVSHLHLTFQQDCDRDRRIAGEGFIQMSYGIRVMKIMVVHPTIPAAPTMANFNPAKGANMDIKRNGSQPSNKGPADWFTGTVRIDPLFQANAPARAAGASVTFEPGARTAWHTHPLGQTLLVTAGCGRVQREGGPVEEVRPGDVVWFPPGEKHWHGAAPSTAMTHIAIQEALDVKVVEWMEHLTDEQYHGKKADR